jgi:hypothetical protein
MARESISLSAEEGLQQKMIDTMGLHYLEALKLLGPSSSTKFILPVEFTGLLKGVSAMRTMHSARTSAATATPGRSRG